MSDFKAYTGRRKRPVRAAQIEAFEKRRPGTKTEREIAARLYEPLDHVSLPLDEEERRDD